MLRKMFFSRWPMQNPISREEFRKGILIEVTGLFILSTIGLILYLIADEHNHFWVKIGINVALPVFVFYFTWRHFVKGIFERRIRGIYKKQKRLNPFIMAIYSIIPFLYLPIIIFLYFKKDEEEKNSGPFHLQKSCIAFSILYLRTLDNQWSCILVPYIHTTLSWILWKCFCSIHLQYILRC